MSQRVSVGAELRDQIPPLSPDLPPSSSPSLAAESTGLCQPGDMRRQLGSLGLLGKTGGQRQGRGRGESQVPLQAARCTDGPGRHSRANLEARQGERDGRPLSGQLQSQLEAISGSLAGGVSGAGEQTPVGVTQALGYGWGCARGVAAVHMAMGKGYECK